ncbi:Glycosyltransferase, catalytic subunit of cellulose synthase and poly-beta-1,6-N-acetylglucosamine synthase [Sphingopyxis sp. YR583]|uniref:glycosyltransferase family 2 protein n=1 Tax=Sphingopyxis sp. YR583 TaxID=1881047 RepID=UPI0008A77153|nr:glycosyltransferase family 2 protein [Sphingopyxis sp. YR583]SEH18219.1 Glycosyltransferase, catalytic subunit of cellulose synthase and poly-beta-1,6-N-acetylglucosamine synthase [Sphingopyxis sp. YR583]
MIVLIAWLIALPLSLSLLYLGTEILFGLRPLRGQPGGAQPTPVRIAILVPAHNEAAGIAATVLALESAAPGAETLVVADNCTDETAALAAQAGAKVAERSDPDRRGKGYALAFGRDALSHDPPAAVIIVDADCRLGDGSASRLAAQAIASGRPVQSANLLVSAEKPAPLVAVSNFAMLIKNLVRARGLLRLGGGAMLFGTGMAFSWPLFARLPLATGDVVEDLSLGLWLAKKGIKVGMDDEALVTSAPASLESSRAQRSRWEHGFLRTAAKQGLPLFLRGLAKASRNLMTLGAHLMVPPLALLMLLSSIAIAALVVIAAISETWVPAIFAGTAFAYACTLLTVAWWRYGRAMLPFAALLRVPLYIVWKIPIYLGLFTRSQTHWNRTKREGEQR